MGRIVGIGGGNMEALETLEIEKEVVELCGKGSPRALFVPTASGDSVERWETFDRIYGRLLGCRTDVLYLLHRRPSEEELRDKILSADLIYVGGGNTLKMMRRWRWLGVDRLLREAHERGTVLAGRSAGMICWFSYGHSDSMAYYRPENWRYIRVKGMGLVNAIGCPHYNSGTAGTPRAADFHRMVAKHPEVGIAADNHCAIEFVDDGYRVITSRPDAAAYRISSTAAGLTIERLQQRKEFAPTAELRLG